MDESRKLREADRIAIQIGRIIDQTTPGRPPLAARGERRLVSRYGRVLPVLLVPLWDGKPSIDEAAFAICQDLSDRGMSLIHNQSLESTELIMGMWYASDDESPYLNEPLFVTGKLKSNDLMGGGFWRTGIEFDTVFMDPVYLIGLQVLAKGLIPLPLLNAEDREVVLGGI